MSQIKGMLAEKIANAKSIAIVTHSTPDADAFASSVALREIIRKSQKATPEGKRSRRRVHVFMEYDKLPHYLEIFFPKKEKETGFSFMNPQRPLKKYDLAIALDCASKERMGQYAEIFDNANQTINIDHHATNTRFADNNVVLKTSSTCEALYYLFLHKAKNDNLNTKYILSLLYSGILTDTNNLKKNADFRTTEQAISIIKDKLGGSLAKRIRANFFESNSVARDELYAFAYNKKHRKYLANDKFCLIVLNHKAFRQSQAELDDAEGIVDEALYRKGVVASAIILEKEKNKLYVKLRSKEGVNISELAQQFEGGGHEQIAAFQFEGAPSALLSKFVPAAEKFVENEKVEDFDSCPELFE